MLSVINSIPELYKTRMTGEIVVDNVVDVLRHTKVLFPEDMAAELNADAVLLRHAWLLLTGVPLREAIIQWRVCQAEELISQFERIEGEGQLKMRQRRAKFLEDVAAQCGWNSGKVMKQAIQRIKTAHRYASVCRYGSRWHSDERWSAATVQDGTAMSVGVPSRFKIA